MTTSPVYKGEKIKLNKKGQCPFCKIKPLIYKKQREYFCWRCDRSYSLETGELVKNWAEVNKTL